MAKLKQSGGDLGPLERAAIDSATNDGAGWIIAPTVANGVLETMASKGLIELERDHWQLTSMGYACSAHAAVSYD
ncbi:MAG: hypothetical protein EOO77_03960 [Oxalobacteraceae bacterium]|nr:MAG: hypothetical protein EOO77_03960 [Oxalobacteraceae bacterium]